MIFSLINTTAGRKKTFRYANKYKFRVFQFSKIFIFPVRKMETVRCWRVSQENGEVEGVYIEVEWSGMGGGGETGNEILKFCSGSRSRYLKISLIAKTANYLLLSRQSVVPG